MHTEPTPVEPIRRPPRTENSELPPTAEELENVTIRVVRLDQLAGAPPAERSAQPAGPRNGMQRSSALPATVAAPPASARAAPRAPAPAAPRPPAAPRAPAPAAPSPAHEARRPAPSSAAPSSAAPPGAAAPAPVAAPAVKASSPVAPAPVARTPASPAMRPAEAPAARSPEVPAARHTPGNRTATAVARPSARVESVEKRRTLSWNRVGFLALVAVIYLGWSMPTERYITPTRGFGYALGIIGGSLMLLLLVYSARK